MYIKAQLATTSGYALLKHLCRHFAHKVPATLTGEQGIIEFPFGRCLIDARADHIAFAVDVGDEQDAAAAERVLGDHLLRMARGDELRLEWTRSES